MHFTYKAAVAELDLQQGDVLQRTFDLTRVIQEIHPYYINEDYRHFAVLTQSCDLVTNRPGSPVKYIALGAVRPLADVIEREVSKYQTNYVLRRANVAPESSRDRLRQFLERLLNNNEPEYLYLHEDAAVGLAKPSCIFLRLSIALHSLHYDVCKGARIVSLDQTFQAKLGWLVGNLYSRVGTDDWVPKTASEPQWRALIQDLLDRNVAFMNDKKIEMIRKTNTEQTLINKTPFEIREMIQRAPERRRKEDAIDVVIGQLSEDNLLSTADLAKVRRRLENDSVFASLFKK
jgi:hypothetical protein